MKKALFSLKLCVQSFFMVAFMLLLHSQNTLAQCDTLAISGRTDYPKASGSCAALYKDTLRANILGGTWSSSDPSIATINELGIVVGLELGYATISYTLSGACAGVYATYLIAVHGTPEITSHGSIDVQHVGVSTIFAGSFSNCSKQGKRTKLKPLNIISSLDGIPWVSYPSYYLNSWNVEPYNWIIMNGDSIVESEPWLPDLYTYSGFSKIFTPLSYGDGYRSILVMKDEFGCVYPADTVTLNVTPTRNVMNGPDTIRVGQNGVFEYPLADWWWGDYLDFTNPSSPYYNDNITINYYYNDLTSSHNNPLTVYGIDTGTVVMTATLVDICFGEYDTIVKPITIVADSNIRRSIDGYFWIKKEINCDGLQIQAVPHKGIPPGIRYSSLVTYYGDGRSDTAYYNIYGSPALPGFSHVYDYSGVYTIKHVLIVDSSGERLDSMSYSVDYTSCSVVRLRLYRDLDANCIHTEGVDAMNYHYFRMSVDSNGVAIDTINIANAYNYLINTDSGTVYRFYSLDAHRGLGCEYTAGFTYTVVPSASFAPQIYVPVRYVYPDTPIANFSIAASGFTRATSASFTFSYSNEYLLSDSVEIEFVTNPAYEFNASNKPLYSSEGGVYKWHAICVEGSSYNSIYISLRTADGVVLPFGTPIHSTVRIRPLTFIDLDSTDNVNVLDRNVIGSLDPNLITVTPKGNILNGVRLNYNIQFENYGNDTAFNIHVMDTLSDDLDFSTFEIVGSSHPATISSYLWSGHRIVKFDFPNINLPDSTHHGFSAGNIMYNINAKTGLPDGTLIPAKVGIYFDHNEVVMTNEEVDTIVIPTVSIGTASELHCITDSILYTATAHSIPNTHYLWYLNDTLLSIDNDTVVLAGISSSDVVRCQIQAIMGDTATALSSEVSIPSELPVLAGSIVDSISLCTGSSPYPLSGITSGVVWTSTTGIAVVDSTISVVPLSAGIDTIHGTITNSCGTDTISSRVIVMPYTTPGVAYTYAPSDSLCLGDTLHFVATATNVGATPSFIWRKDGLVVATDSVWSGMFASSGELVCVVLSSANCNTVDSAIVIDTITFSENITPTITINVSPNDSVSTLGESVVFTASVTGEGSAPQYQWYVDGVAISGATSNTYTRAVYDNDSVYCKLTSSVQCATTNVVSSAVKIVYADYLTTGVKTINTMGGIKVYPNPSNGVIHVEGEIGAGNAGIVEVRDVVGRVVYSAVLPIENGRVNSELNLGSQLVNGNYILRIVNGTTDYNMHIVINR